VTNHRAHPQPATDVIVVGGGVIGTCTALELAQRGASVRLIEALPRLGDGCSGGNAGLLCPSHVEPIASRAALKTGIRWLFSRTSPFALHPRPSLLPWLVRYISACTSERERAAIETIRAMSLASLLLHEHLNEAFGTGVARRGTLNVYETHRFLEYGVAEAAANRAAGLRNELMTSKAATAFEPALKGAIAGAIYYPDDLSGDPAEFINVLGRAASRAGATLTLRTRVTALKTRGSRVEGVETSNGDYHAKSVVLATGVWTPRLLRNLTLNVPVQAGKGYHVDYRSSNEDPRVPVYLQEARVVATPFADTLRLAGTFELSGNDLRLSWRRIAALQNAAERQLKSVATRAPFHTWSGLRPCAPDGLPMIGRTLTRDNLFLNTAHAMLGFTLAPLSATLVADLLAEKTPAFNLRAIDPNRFGTRRRMFSGRRHAAPRC
jgi:D-amino-acid dehydrogenase